MSEVERIKGTGEGSEREAGKREQEGIEVREKVGGGIPGRENIKFKMPES